MARPKSDEIIKSFAALLKRTREKRNLTQEKTLMTERMEEQNKGILPKLIDRLGLIMVLVGVWFLFYPKPYEVLFVVLMLLCPLFLLLYLSNLKRNPDYSRVETFEPTKDKKKELPYLPAIGVVSLLVLIRLHIDIDSYYSLVFILVPLVILFLYMWTERFIKQKQNKKYFALIVGVFIFGFAIIFGANSIYDKSEPITFYAEVLDKKESKSSRGRRDYDIKVTSWKPRSENERISVSRRQYNEIQIGQTVEVRIRKGLFNLPYYYIMLENRGKNEI